MDELTRRVVFAHEEEGLSFAAIGRRFGWGSYQVAEGIYKRHKDRKEDSNAN